VIDRTSLGESRIPWSHRGRIGRWRAYWRTVRLAARQPGKLAQEIARPASFADAVRFRRVTALLAFVPVAAIMVYLYVVSLELGIEQSIGPWGSSFTLRQRQAHGGLLRGENAPGWLLEWAVLAALLAGLWLLLLASSGVASYFFHPRRLPPVQQNRAVTLSYYACAPLALTPLSAGLVAGVAVILSSPLADTFGWVQVAGAMQVAAVVIALIQLLLWYVGTLVLLKRATHCGAGRVLAAGAALPVVCALLAVLTLVVLPAAVAFVGIVILSLF
jgi:hypothetical protein